jgi:hypothetical protein
MHGHMNVKVVSKALCLAQVFCYQNYCEIEQVKYVVRFIKMSAGEHGRFIN